MILRRDPFRDAIRASSTSSSRTRRTCSRTAARSTACTSAADREDREEAYGDFVDAVETATEALADMRDRFGRTLDEDAAEEYEDSFNRAVRKRWPDLGLEIENR